MYFKYSWLTTATEANVLADIVKIFTGETAKANLSASCDTANSDLITNTVITNWVVYDAAASATSQVLRSLNSDASTYKYMQVILSAGAFSITTWESWNSTTHVGTNQSFSWAALLTSATITGTVTFSYTTATTIYLLTTPRFAMYARSPVNANSYSGVYEFSRDTNALNTTYPCHALLSGSDSLPTNFAGTTAAVSSVGLCRIKNPAAAGDITLANSTTYNNFFSNLITNYHNGGIALQNATTYGPGEVPYLTSWPIILTAGTSSSNLQVFGKVLGGLLFIPNTLPSYNNIDEASINGTTYVLMKMNNGALAVPKQ